MRNAALKNGSNKSGDVADDATAQTNHKRTPIDPASNNSSQILSTCVSDFNFSPAEFGPNAVKTSPR